MTLRVQLTAINTISKPPRRRPLPKRKARVFDFVPVEYEIDPELVQLQFKRVEDKTPLHIGILTLRKDDLKRLKLMPGDIMTVKLLREWS